MSGEGYCPQKFQWDGLKKKEAPCIKSLCEWWIKYGEGEKVAKEGCAICFIAMQQIPIFHKK